MLDYTDASVYCFCACFSLLIMCMLESTVSVHAGGWPFPRSWRSFDQVQATDEPDHPGLHHSLGHGGTAQVSPAHAAPATCRIVRPYRDAQDRLLWRDKTCPAHT